MVSKKPSKSTPKAAPKSGAAAKPKFGSAAWNAKYNISKFKKKP